MRKLLVLSFLIVSSARADSINDVAQELRADSVLTFRSGVAKDLASNILVAQAEADYGGPLSLELSIEAVLRAIVIEQIYGNAKYVGFFDYTPLPWLQSEVATNPDATATLTPSSINFGEVPVSTPEPATLLLLLLGILFLAVLA